MIVIDGYKLNDIAVEAFTELRNSQESKDFLKYFDVATESISNPETRVKLVNKLYEDLMKHGYVEFGTIPKSQGDLTKYEHYKVMVDTIKRLGDLTAGMHNKEMEMTEKLFNMIIKCRSDFEYGFKFEIELLKFSYNTLVLALHKMIDITIASYINYVYETIDHEKASGDMVGGPMTFAKEFSMSIKYPRSNYAGESKFDKLVIVEGVRQVITIYEKGEWTDMVLSFKKGRNNWLGTVGALATSLGVVEPGSNRGVVNITNSAGATVLGVVSLIVTIIAIRKIIYVFYASAYKLDEAIKRNKAFLEFTLKTSSQPLSAIKKQEELLSFYNKIQDVIETKIFAEDVKASKSIKESNRQRFTITDLGPNNFSSATIVEGPGGYPSQSSPYIENKTEENKNISNDFSFF